MLTAIAVVARFTRIKGGKVMEYNAKDLDEMLADNTRDLTEQDLDRMAEEERIRALIGNPIALLGAQ